MRWRTLRRLQIEDQGREDGMTLVELIVAMGILTIMLTVSMAAITTMTNDAVRAKSVTDATDQLRVTFQQMDKEIRYASAINAPASTGTGYYVEYLVEANAASGAEQCVQWRYVTASGELQRRTATPGGTPSEWRTTVTKLRNDLTVAAQRPFKLTKAGTTADGKVYTKQQLAVYLDTGMGTAEDPRGGQLNVQLVALNSSTSSPDTVCLTGGLNRP
jgi:prepilin-type N-terminal cleavage/methylation domain-containing protein